ncbi:MAG: hypothetical protein R3320_04565 [Nitriliruptorales bacterium]|nr:hypothetical protein [Nitriliruptorales bacterium]
MITSTSFTGFASWLREASSGIATGSCSLATSGAVMPGGTPAEAVRIGQVSEQRRWLG